MLQVQETTGATGAEGSYNTPFGTINVGGQNVYKGSYDPDLFAGGTPYNEYLLGNTEKGIPDYLSSYMQNTPYYQYQDQQLNNIYGGGGYGTPGFDGSQQMMMPQQSSNNQIAALNQRIADLMSQINPTPTEEVTEEGTEESTEKKKEDKNTSPKWERIDSYRNDDGVTVITLKDTNPNSSTFNTTKTELDESTKTKKKKEKEDSIWTLTDTKILNNGQSLNTYTDQYGDVDTRTEGPVTMELVDGVWVKIGSTKKETEAKTVVSRVDNGDGTFTVTYSDGTTDIEGTKTVTEAKTVVSRVDNGDGTFTITYSDGTTGSEGTKTVTTVDAGAGTDTIDGSSKDDEIVDLGTTSITTPFGTIEVPLTQDLIDAGYTSTANTTLTQPALTTVEDAASNSSTDASTIDEDFANQYGFDPNNFNFNFASGGQIKNSINTLEQYAQPLPMGNISLGNMYAEGGMVQDDKVDALMQNPVIQEKMSEGDRGLLQQASFVLLGRIDDDGSIISEFVDKFGSDALDMLKGELLPDMQQQGMIEGEGGGMDDKVDGVIGDQERVAVSPGEYIVPADVVGNLGDGNSEQGARIMDDFLARVRTEKHGTEKQPNPINLNNVMPS